MKDKQLFQKQAEFIRKHKKEILKPFQNAKIGMTLNSAYYIMGIVSFYLKKHFTIIDSDIVSEKFLNEEFKDFLDKTLIKKDDDFSLKEALKKEVEMTVYTNYILDYYKNIFKPEQGLRRIYPSETKRAEKALKNQINRANKIIDDFFKERDIYYSEIKEIIEDYEIQVHDKGKLVDFHFGFKGFTLNGEYKSIDIINYVKTQKENAERNKLVFEKFINKFDFLEKNEITPQIINYEHIFDIHNYQIVRKSKDAFDKILKELEYKLNHLSKFLYELKEKIKQIPKDIFFDIKQNKIVSEFFNFDFEKNDVESFIQEYTIFKNVREIVKNIKTKFTKETTIIPKIVLKNNNLTIKTRIWRNSHDESFKHWKELSRTFICKNDGLYRLSGEKVLVEDIIVYELLEDFKNSEKEYFMSLERAKEMFLSTLTDEEAKLYNNENLTVIEGEQNYYVVQNITDFNNVVKIPKDMKSIDEMQALCIMPSEYTIPKFDMFASIVLSIKSKDEDYILKNSNSFTVNSKVKNKILNIFNEFFTNKQQNFALN